MAFLAGAVALLVRPVGVIRGKQQAPVGTGYAELARGIYAAEGPAAFDKGTAAALSRAFFRVGIFYSSFSSFMTLAMDPD